MERGSSEGHVRRNGAGSRRALTPCSPDVPMLTRLASCAVEKSADLTSLLKREAQMQSPSSQAAGWPIGSGMVERAHKRVLQARAERSRDAMDRSPNCPTRQAIKSNICGRGGSVHCIDRKSTRLKSSHQIISYTVFSL